MARTLRVTRKKATGKVAKPKNTFGAFTPWAPGMPPAGSYDPSIDASVSSAQRGNQYLLGNTPGVQGVGAYDSGDLDVQQRRADENLAIGLEGIGRTRTKMTGDLQRQFDILAGRQQSAFRAQGLLGGGVAQALARRKANQAYEQAPINEQYGGGAPGDYGLAGRQLQLDYTRGGEDRTTQAGRATTELGAFTGDARTSAWAQAQQSNPFLTPNTKDPNEHTVGNQTYRLIRNRKGVLMKRLPSGRIVPRSDMSVA